MSAFVIEKGVPVSLGRGNAKYPFRQMVAGDSFLVPLKEEPLRAVMARMNSAVQSHKARHPEFKWGVLRDSEGAGVRVHCVARVPA